MPLDIPAIQRALAADGLDGWLLYDFHGSNPIAVSLAALTGAHTTRRWFYFVPASGRPVKLVHAVEPHVLDALPGTTRIYAGRQQLERAVAETLAGARVVAMEYSPECAIPCLSRVDAGTVDFLRRLGTRVVSSGDLVGRFEAAWDAEAVATHRAASEKLYRIKDEAFAYVTARLAAGDPVHEFDVQRRMLAWFGDEGLIADAPPIVAAQEHSGNPHYAPTEASSRPIRTGELLLVDLWGKIDRPGSVYADITWVGYAGTPPPEVVAIFDAVVAGRDAALARVQAAVAAGQTIHGWEVDRAARDAIAAAGFGDQFVHRTGHSLGREVHGNGVHMDDYETRDDRRLLDGTAFTIEPGVYTPRLGIRSEINVVVLGRTAEPTGPCQTSLTPIGPQT